MVGHRFSVKILRVRIRQRLDSFDDVVEDHSTAEFKLRRRFDDVQRANFFDVDEDVAFDDFKNRRSSQKQLPNLITQFSTQNKPQILNITLKFMLLTSHFTDVIYFEHKVKKAHCMRHNHCSFCIMNEKPILYSWQQYITVWRWLSTRASDKKSPNSGVTPLVFPATSLYFVPFGSCWRIERRSSKLIGRFLKVLGVKLS